MGQNLVLKKISRNNVFIDNIFYGREVSLALQWDGRPIGIEVRRQDRRFSTAIKLTIGRYACTLFLEVLPPLATFSKQFDGIDFFSLPKEICLLAFQSATEALKTHFSNILKTEISIDAIEKVAGDEAKEGIDFVVTSGQNHVSAGTLVAPREILVLLAKNIGDTPPLHRFDNLEMTYRICVGSTWLSKEDYRELCEEDVVFLDQHDLAKEKKVDIVGFGGMKIRGNFTPSGVVIRQIVG
ncbi:MAG: hypothetical protein LBI77_02915 [Puniceicoccales bacterium]|jgi:hypothetical protein|nr:hypothetical protein [Puniceicoccales bacterium]